MRDGVLAGVLEDDSPGVRSDTFVLWGRGEKERKTYEA